MQSAGQFINRCEECGKTFSTQRAVRDHVRKVHSKKSFKCYHCSHVAKAKQHLVYHMKVHMVPRNRATNQFGCPMCPHSACDRKSMLRHYEECHDVSLTPKTLKFKSFDDFLSWKSSLQKTEHCSYVADGGGRKTVNTIFRLYRCFRDGFFSSKGKGKRRLKVCGSCKINGFCPSAISCSEDRHSGVVDVNYIVAHVGHETDVGRLNLTKDEKDVIAQKIAAKVPFGVILDEIRDFGIDHELDRAKLVTRKDLWNIKREYNLDTDGAIHPDDRASDESWANQMNDDPDIFKEQGTTSPPHNVNMFLEVEHQEQPQGSTDPSGMMSVKLEVIEHTPLLTPSYNDMNSHQRDRQPHEDFDKAREELMEEIKNIVEAATCYTHLGIIRNNIRPSLSMMEAFDNGLQFKLYDSSKKKNPRTNVSSSEGVSF